MSHRPRRRRVLCRRPNVPGNHVVTALPVYKKQTLVCDDIHQPRHSAGGSINERRRACAEQGWTNVASHPEAMREVVVQLASTQGAKVVLECDALAQLAYRVLAQLVIQLRLPEKHHLQQLPFLSFQ